MNGIVKGDKTSIAAWYGGPMVDRDTFTSEELETKVPGTDYAMSLLRHDGTGYLAGGNIHWNANGVLIGNFNSFILQGTSMITMFYYIRLFYLHTANQDSTDFNNIDYVTPMKTFSRLSVLPLGGVEGGNNLPTGLFIGDSNTGGSFQIGNIILRTKSGDPNILEIVSADSKKTAHLGVQGGVSAYGTYTPSTGGGGGLNATVVSYANILKGNYVDTDLTSIPNAYSVKALSNRIDNIATELDGLNLSWNNITDKPTTFTPSAHNHKWIDITDRITKVSQLTNDAGYLTTHQSLADYYTRAEIDAKGYTTNKGTVTSVGLTLPTGLTCAINTITTSGTFAVTFASGYSIPTTTKQSSWDSAVSVKHSHSNKTVLDGITSTKVTNWDSTYRWYSLITTDEETADGIINKWNEVVNFLANIAQTDTLSGIIDGINTSISNEVSRAKKAEGTNASNISANKTSITTLQGYFTSGSAKKALQLTTARNLWGNAFNGTADVNGSIVLPSDKYISIGNIKLEYDATNKALKITNTTTDEVANLYASGGVSAYGVGSVAGSGGGGLNGTIVPYSTAITSDPQNEGSKIASASSIYKLHSRISAIENNGATSITVTGTGNAITSVSKTGTSITFTKGATFLTSHQSLANYYTKGQVDNIANGKSSTSHTHSVIINGVTKTIAATGGTAVNLGTYLTSHQSLADYAKKSEIPTKLSQLTNDKNFVTGSVSGQTITINGVSTTWQNTWRGITDSYSGTSTGTSLSQKGANSLYNALHNGYASSAGNSDTVDGYHASHLLVKRGRLGDYNIDHETTFGTRDIQPSSEITISGKKPFNGWGTLLVIGSIDGASNNQLAFTGSNRMYIRCAYGSRNNYNTNDWATVALTSDNVASATKLATARTIWGQSFDGTGNVNGTIYINNSDSRNGAIILNNNVNTHARISAIKDQVVFNTGAAIRFGATNWEYSDWAGLKYDTVANAIYLGIADGTVFNYHSNKRSNGTLKFPGITTITPDSGARIGGSGGNLYLGNANDSGWVCTQSICSQTNSSLWSIRQDGNAYFKNIYSGAATINGNLSVDGLISNKGILPTNYEVNNKGPACYVSADALCSGITAITDSIQVNQVTVQYSNDNGNSWTNYPMSNDAKFNLYANNAGLNQVYLGYNVITGNNDAEKLAQVKKNELIVSFYISNNCYAQPYFASVDISNGVYTICIVEILNNSGVVLETYTKRMTGWNQLNYINLSNGNTSQGVGNDNRRYIRFRFKHEQNTNTALRNTVINKIRIFSFTKYSFPTDRFMGHTGHIYNFDYNMNTYFPNSILAKGGVTAYQSSDVRLKTNITKLNCLKVIKSIGGTYEFDYIRDHKHSIGFIAQNVNNPLLKDIIAKDDNGYLKINYWNPKLISLAFGALTEIDDEVDKLKARVRELENEVEYLKNKAYALQ